MIYYKGNKGNIIQGYLYAFFPKKHLKAARLDNETLQKIEKENKNLLLTKLFLFGILFGLIPTVFNIYLLTTSFITVFNEYEELIVLHIINEMIEKILIILTLPVFLYIFFYTFIKTPQNIYEKLYLNFVENTNISFNNLYRLTQNSRNKKIREAAKTAIFYRIAVLKENPKFIDDNNKLIEYVDNDVHEKLLKLGKEYLNEPTLSSISINDKCLCKTCLCLNSKECDKDTCICENCDCENFNSICACKKCSCGVEKNCYEDTCECEDCDCGYACECENCECDIDSECLDDNCDCDYCGCLKKCECEKCDCDDEDLCSEKTCVCEPCACLFDSKNIQMVECSCIKCECEYVDNCLNCSKCLYCECLNQTLNNINMCISIKYETVNENKSEKLKEYLLAKEVEKTKQYSTYVSPHFKKIKKIINK
jgi:hypothetical protein